MIYLGVEYGATFVLENPLPIPTATGKTNLVVDPVFANTSFTAQWETGSVKIALREVGAEVPLSSTGPRAALEVEAATSGFIGTKTAIKVGVERIDFGFWAKAPVGAKMAVESLAYKTGGTLISGAATNFTGTGTWQWVSATRTMPAETAEAKFRVKTLTTNAGVIAFYVWGGMVTKGRSTLIAESEYFPTVAQLKNGEAKYNGVEGESTVSQYLAVARAVFNDPTDPDYVGILDPESSGLDAPEIREDSNDRVESDGAIFGDFFSGKRPIVFQGTIIASSLAQRNERAGKLRAASNAKTADATLWWEDAAGGKVFVNVRRQQPLRVTKGWKKEFQLALVASDSRILAYVAKASSAKGLTASSQEKLPTASGELFGGLTAGEVTGAEWANFEKIFLSDNVYATQKPTSLFELGEVKKAYPLYGMGYGFTIPNTSIITGVEVRPEAKAEEASKIYLGEVFISRAVWNGAIFRNEDWAGLNGGQINGGRKFVTTDYPLTYLPTADSTIAVGSSSDMWKYNKYLTPAYVNGTEFGAAVSYYFKGAKTASIDALAIKIYYVTPLSVTATNEGNAPAPAIIKVKGPLKNFYVMNQTTGEILTYTGEVEANKELWFDTQNVTVTERGTGITSPINRFANVGLPNDWITIQPGANTILVAGINGTASTELLVEYRNAWE